MSYYRVLADGVDIHDPMYREMTLVGASCKTSVDAAGSFDFTFPANHVFRDSLIPYGSSVEVLEDGESIFFGRPLPYTIDLYGQCKVHCEGALAFLNDVICPPFADGLSEEMTDKEYFEFLISYYNEKQPRQDRRFVIGDTPPAGLARKHEWSFRSCMDEIRNNVIPYTKGFLSVYRENNTNFISWCNSFPETAEQPIRIGLNMMDAMRTGRTIYTAAIAKGADGAEMSEPVVMPADVVQKYGHICTYLTFPSVNSKTGLAEACHDFLYEQQFGEMDYEVDAVDLHVMDNQFNLLKVGQMVGVRLMDLDSEVSVPIKDITTDINTGIKKINVSYPGVGKPTLTEAQIADRYNMELLVEDLTELIGIPSMPELIEQVEQVVSTVIDSLTPTQKEEVQQLVTNLENSDNLTEATQNVQAIADYVADNTDSFPQTVVDNLSNIGSAMNVAADMPSVYDLANGGYDSGGGGGSSGDGWIHQIDGVEQETGTVNFVTIA